MGCNLVTEDAFHTMKLTIALSDLQSLLKTLAPRPKAADTFTLSACAARVFVDFKGDIGGVEALVFADGTVVLPTKIFRETPEPCPREENQSPRG